MTKRGLYKKQNRLPPFVPLTWELLNSTAYKHLPPSAAKALPLFLGKVKVNHNDAERYRTDFTFSYPEAQNFGFAPGTFSGVIHDLVRLGFIDPVSKGGLRGKGKAKNIFRLSNRWRQHGTNDFKSIEWRTFY